MSGRNKGKKNKRKQDSKKVRAQSEAVKEKGEMKIGTIVKWSRDLKKRKKRRRKCASMCLIGKTRAVTQTGLEVLFLLGPLIVRSLQRRISPTK